MKKANLTLIVMISVSLFLFQRCNHSGKTTGNSASDSTIPPYDSTKSAIHDTTGKSAQLVNKNDAKFAVEAANGGMAEVELGSLSQEKSSNPKVKQFGAMMVTDHSKANNELVALVKSKNIVLPNTVSTDKQNIRKKLSEKTGTDFDKAYINEMVDDHKKDIKMFEDAVKNVHDRDLKAFAVKTLPVLKKHLAAVEQIHDNMK